MTIQELLDQLTEAQAQLDQGNVSGAAKRDLQRVIIATERAIIGQAVAPLKDIGNLTVTDVSQLRELTKQLGQDIENEQKRTALVGKIVGIAKTGLRGVLPLPI